MKFVWRLSSSSEVPLLKREEVLKFFFVQQQRKFSHKSKGGLRERVNLQLRELVEASKYSKRLCKPPMLPNVPYATQVSCTHTHNLESRGEKDEERREKKVPSKWKPQKAQLCAYQQKLVISQQSRPLQKKQREIPPGPSGQFKTLGRCTRPPT